MSNITSSESFSTRAAFWLTGCATVAVLFSIAASQILLALALIALLFSGVKLRFPPLVLPLALFAGGTVLSLALSGDTVAGRVQLRKLALFAVLLVVYSAFRELPHLRNLVLCWAGAAALGAARGLVQFGEKYREAHFAGQSFYEYYVGQRITGFMSHWMTFSGQIVMVLLLLCAFVFFSPSAKKKALGAAVAGAAIISGAILLGFTRGIWLAVAVSGVFLIALWRRRLLLALPVLVVVGALAAPNAVRHRVTSMFQPKGDMDSNQFRIVCWRTGWAMIKAHPWFGLGPEQVRIQFDKWVPPDVPRPLPTGWYGHLHSIYVHYAAERGVPTMLAFLWVLGKALVDFLRAARRLPPGRGDVKFLLHGPSAVIVSVLVSGIFELNLGDSEVLILFLSVLAVGYAARDHAMAPGAAPLRLAP